MQLKPLHRLYTPVMHLPQADPLPSVSLINLTNLILCCYGLDQDSVSVVYPSRNIFGQDCITNFQHNIPSTRDYCI